MMMEHEAYKGLIDKLEFDNRGEEYMWCEEPLSELVNDTADLAVETARRTCDYTAPPEAQPQECLVCTEYGTPPTEDANDFMTVTLCMAHLNDRLFPRPRLTDGCVLNITGYIMAMRRWRRCKRKARKEE